MLRWSPTRYALPLLALVACLVALPVVAGGTAGADGGFDGETAFIVELDPDGDATWQITERVALTDEDETAAFAEMRERFEDGESDLESVTVVERAIERVDGRTDRSMTLTGQDRESDIEGTGENRTGTLTVSFTWDNFARVGGEDNGRLQIDDVFRTEEGLWLPRLAPDQELLIRLPEGYGARNVPPVGLDNGELRWEGPTEFDTDSFAATFVGDGTSGNETNGSNDSEFGLLGVLLAGVAVAVVAAVLVRYRDRLADRLGREPRESGAGPAGTETAAAADSDPDTGTETDTGAETAEDDSDDGIDEELLSDEERVERLLERNGGRMKQADIVDETGWSNAKVSQLLSSMAEEGRIDKLRIGRENLISFPDVDVTDTGTES